MNAKELINKLVAALIQVGVANKEDIFVGRIYPGKVRNGIWSVTSLGGSSEGGNLAKCRIRYQVQITGYDVDAERLYDKDELIAQAIASLVGDPHIINYSITPLTDADEVGLEQRAIQWVAEILTYAPGWLEQ